MFAIPLRLLIRQQKSLRNYATQRAKVWRTAHIPNTRGSWFARAFAFGIFPLARLSAAEAVCLGLGKISKALRLQREGQVLAHTRTA